MVRRTTEVKIPNGDGSESDGSQNPRPLAEGARRTGHPGFFLALIHGCAGCSGGTGRVSALDTESRFLTGCAGSE
jgi:hypothetical protein